MGVGLRDSDPGDRSNFRVGDPTGGKGLVQDRQRPQCRRDPKMLTGGIARPPEAPPQPLGVGPGPLLVPSPELIELENHIHEPAGGGIDVGAQLGDVIGELREDSEAITGCHVVQYNTRFLGPRVRPQRACGRRRRNFDRIVVSGAERGPRGVCGESSADRGCRKIPAAKVLN